MVKISIPGKMFSEVTKHLGKKRATVLYPFEEVRPPEEFRGKLKFDDESCVGCKLCELDCPAFAIKIDKENDKITRTYYEDRCIFCGQCAESCAVKAVVLTKGFELAQAEEKKFVSKSTFEVKK